MKTELLDDIQDIETEEEQVIKHKTPPLSKRIQASFIDGYTPRNPQ